MSAMKLLLVLTLSGFVAAIGGLVYGVLAVGVPCQDPTPAQAAAERASAAISGWAMGGGTVMTLAGLVGIAFVGASRLVKSGS
jgi:hypothetical protein